ncbi:MAG: D-hexose-6-phosphate mutarotase [Sideroxydans sp.]
MITLDSLNRQFGLADQLRFVTVEGGLAVAEIINPHARARIALQGAHLTHWQPKGEQPVIWLSPKARFAPGKSIRGGVPICWPWFGPHQSDSKLPGHGFARTVMWDVQETQALTDGSTFIRLGLIESDATRAQWPHPCSARLEVTVGKTLRVELVTTNTGEAPFELSEALHTYFQISDVGNMTIRGLEGCDYLDKVHDFARRTQQGPIAIESEVDRVYVNTTADCVIEDKGLQRAIRIAKQGSRSTVVWNPWQEKAEKMGDFGPALHRDMVCVESGNALENSLNVQPGETHRLVAIYSVEKL